MEQTSSTSIGKLFPLRAACFPCVGQLNAGRTCGRLKENETMSAANTPDPQHVSQPLEPTQLRWTCDVSELDFQTTDELPDLHQLLGQDRALSALEFGISMRREGYHLYVMGPTGVGKRTAVMQALAGRGPCQVTPPDWIYVNNFDDLRKPRAIPMAAGRGIQFRQDIDDLIEDLTTAIPDGSRVG
jgi:hypothetical protein